MKVKKTLLFLLLSALLIFTAGCNKNAETEIPEDHVSDKLIVTDCLGREVELPENVDRVGCLYAFTGHVTAMLGRGDDIVAINNGLSRDVLLNMVSPGIEDNPVVYFSGKLNIEELLKAEPDLLFVETPFAQTEAEAAKLDKFNITYIAIDFNNMEEQMTAIQTIGDALGMTEKAREYNQYYQDCIDRVSQVSAEIPQDKRVRLYHSVNEATRTDTKDSLAADWLEKVGVINVSVNQELKFLDGKNFASLEQILLWDPEVILVNESGVGEYMLNNSQWASLKAVKEGRVYQMPIGISRWGHPGGMETPLAILWTAKTIYPEYFEDLDMKKETRYYYKQFFNYDMSDEQIERILQGEEKRKPKGS